MGYMDKLAELGLSENENVRSGAFGENKDPWMGKGAVYGILDALAHLVGRDNKVQHLDSASLATAGSAGLKLTVDDDDWSTTAADWSIVAGGSACTVNSVTAGTGDTEIDIDTPALSAGTAVITVSAKRLGCAAFEKVGSLSVAVA